MKTVPARHRRVRTVWGCCDGHQRKQVSVWELTDPARGAFAHGADHQRHRRAQQQLGRGSVDTILLTGWAPTLRLLAVLSAPLLIVGIVAPAAVGATAVPLIGGVMLTLRPVFNGRST